MKKALAVGRAGYYGRILMPQLLEEGLDVAVFDIIFGTRYRNARTMKVVGAK
ncbi:MAG: hypothetical protein WAW10_13320 [Gallionella sp.]